MNLTGRVLRTFGPLSDTAHAPSIVPRHAHAPASFCLVTHGQVREGEVTYARHDVIFRVPGQEHENAFDRPARCFNVLVEPAHLDRASGPANVRPALPLLSALRRELRADPSPLVVEGLVLQLVGEVFRSGHRKPSVAREALRIIGARFTEALTVRGIADEIGVHPAHMAREFRALRGTTIGEAIRAQRLQYAMELLSDARHSIADVALRTGFADQSHFTRVFRRIVGTTPHRWRLRR